MFSSLGSLVSVSDLEYKHIKCSQVVEKYLMDRISYEQRSSSPLHQHQRLTLGACTSLLGKLIYVC